ncbi:hypothetical protein [Rhodococcus rhodochrous]|uniref:hypothetical protein n=1 Tax=Rhodococcus rhodochrous TaxID=1829 RepID=UPI003F53FC3B
MADPGRRFDDLFNLVHDPATLIVAFDRVAGNRGAKAPGVDGMTVADVEEYVGAPGFLNDLRTSLKDGSFRPLPVRERTIPKPGGSGKVRRLGIPTVADRVVQAALKLVLEPIFEADFEPVSFGFRPHRRRDRTHRCAEHPLMAYRARVRQGVPRPLGDRLACRRLANIVRARRACRGRAAPRVCGSP